MPYKIEKSGKKYKVKGSDGKEMSKGTTKTKAEAQKRLLYGVEHGWKPTGKKKIKEDYKNFKEFFSEYIKH